jgi:uncharacterized protein Yka (UPF0111/DUF47 family)
MKQNKFNYFEAFAAQARLARTAARFLREALTQTDALRLAALAEESLALEAQAAGQKNQISAVLAEEFLPPLEREDIFGLASALAAVTEGFCGALRLPYALGARVARPLGLDLAQLAEQACAALEGAVGEFKSCKRLQSFRQKTQAVHAARQAGAARHTNALRELFGQTADYRDLFVWTEIYNALARCPLLCARAADTLELAALRGA